MRQVVSVLVGAMVLWAGTSCPPVAAGEIFSASVRGNRANQVIAGFPASTVNWDIERGQVSLVSFSSGRTLLVLRAKGLIIPAIGFNPSPDILARVVCHDATGTPFEAARTAPVPFEPDGDAVLIAKVAIPDPCFAPIVLVTGSTDPAGNRPGNWFAVSGF
ncbi:MAG: hypothetical protein L0271_10100 [Gemmatimonadetes bacterium]|nr:hypothetical protein [Gemmatimonadota bacterium]